MAKDFNEYSNFVDQVTSEESKNYDAFELRARELHQNGLNVPRFLTGAIGLGDEGGEVQGLAKKIVFQGKTWNEEQRHELKKELGDVVWYWMNTCLSAGIDPYEAIEENIKKLESRYPGGKFDAWYSENRSEGDT